MTLQLLVCSHRPLAADVLLKIKSASKSSKFLPKLKRLGTFAQLTPADLDP